MKWAALGFLLLFPGAVFGYQGGTLKNHNHSATAGDGGQLSNPQIASGAHVSSGPIINDGTDAAISVTSAGVTVSLTSAGVTLNGGGQFNGSGAGLTNLPEASLSTQTAFTDKINTFTYTQNYQVVNATQAVFSGFSAEGNISRANSGALQIGNNNAFCGLLDYWDAGSTIFSVNNTYDLATASIRFRMRTNPGNNALTAMTILGSGNVGIGTTNPSTFFNVYNPSVGRISSFTAAGHELTVYGDSTGAALFTEGLEDFWLGTNGNQQLTIKNGGRVGVNTTSPAAQLDINGSFRASGQSTMFGTVAADSAPAGSYGEFITASMTGGNRTPQASNTATSLATMTLTAGNWMIFGSCGWLDGATTAATQVNCTLSTVANVAGSFTGNLNGPVDATMDPSTSANIGVSLNWGPIIANYNTSKTIYLVATPVYSVLGGAVFTSQGNQMVAVRIH